MSGSWISVTEAAEELGVSPVVVRHRLSHGQLVGRRAGRQWLVDVQSLEDLKRNRPAPGRPMSPNVAWSVLLAASGDRAGAREAVDDDRYFYRALKWPLQHSLADDRSRLRLRAEAERFHAHPAELRRIADRPDVVRTGVAAGGQAGLVGGPRALEVYAPASHRRQLVEDHALEPGDGQLLVRWAPDSLWGLLDRDGDGEAPRAAVLLDLLETRDPRARREARRALAQLVENMA
jgi:hypothetical protein